MMTLNELLATLRQPVPPTSLKIKDSSASMVYLPWYRAAELADERIGGAWSYHILDHWIEEVPRGSTKGGYTMTGMAHVRVCVTIVGSDCTVSREAVGVDDDPTGQRGTPFERATGAGLRRALAVFGLGRELYDKETSDRLLSEAKGRGKSQTQASAQARPAARGTAGARQPRYTPEMTPTPTPPAAPEPHYSSEIEAIASTNDGLAICEAIATTTTGHHRSAALRKCMVKMAGLARDGFDIELLKGAVKSHGGHLLNGDQEAVYAAGQAASAALSKAAA